MCIRDSDASSTVARLMDMGMEPYMISSALVGVVAQRLMRKLCPECRVADVPTTEEHCFLGEGIETCLLYTSR